MPRPFKPSSLLKRVRSKSICWAPLFLLLASACSIGVGEGVITGVVTVESCGLENTPVRVDPDYFAAEVVEEGIVSITVQEGSDFGESNNGLAVEVLDATVIKEQWLNLPIQLEAQPEQKVLEMTVYLNNICNAKHFVVMRAVSGTVIFHSMYAPEIDTDEKEIRVTFSNVVFDGSSAKEEMRATLSGDFEFIYSRGRPLQRFP